MGQLWYKAGLYEVEPSSGFIGGRLETVRRASKQARRDWMESALELEAAAVENSSLKIAEVAARSAFVEADVKNGILLALVWIEIEVGQALSTINV